jgi:hypothetical protein
MPAPEFPGVEFAVLYESASELVLLERWAPGISIAVPVPGGIELLVLDGGFTEGGEEFTRYSWLRLPAGSTLRAAAGPQGCCLWVKSGHLSHAPRSPAPPKDIARSQPERPSDQRLPLVIDVYQLIVSLPSRIS